MSADRAAHFLEHLAARRSSLREEIEDDISNERGLTLEERGKRLESVCRDAMAILRGRLDFEQAIQHQDQRSAESMATWLRLVRQYRALRAVRTTSTSTSSCRETPPGQR